MTTNPKDLGHLERVELRDVWESESADFTPWLAKPENLVLLGDTIGLELELVAQEKSVGPFRADILCKDTATGDWVLVENQLERSDHGHLGQLLTYAAGLKAVTIVWIAEQFTEEHRATLDWLNEITGEQFSFFALEIELWRIGTSPVAPKFNVACRPNNWTKPSPPNLTETEILQQEYWTGLRTLLLDRKSIVRPQKPLPQTWASFAIGRAAFAIYANIHIQKSWIRVAMGCYGPDAKAHFHLLQQQKEAIEQEIGCALDWDELPGKKESRISLRKNDVDLTNRDEWKSQQLWMAEELEAFYKAFAPRVKELNAEDFEAPEAE